MAFTYGITKAEMDYVGMMPKQVRSVGEASSLIRTWKYDFNKSEKGTKRYKELANNLRLAGHGKRAYIGAIGEFKTVDVLSRLPENYHIVCGVESTNECVNGNQIDVAVVGPSGIYAIEVKNLRAQPKKPWKAQKHGKKANMQAHNCAKLLGENIGIQVTPIIVDVQHALSDEVTKYKEVKVAHLENLNEIIKNNENMLNKSKVRKYAKMLREKITISEKIKKKLAGRGMEAYLAS